MSIFSKAIINSTVNVGTYVLLYNNDVKNWKCLNLRCLGS